MLPHTDILHSMNNVIGLAFKKSKNKFISVYEKSGSWSNKPHANTFKFDAESLKSTLKIVIEHSYLSVGDMCYQQSVSVPVGVKYPTLIANLTLFWYEYDDMNKLLKTDYNRAIKSNGCYRLMDYISLINSDGVFEEANPFIYPESLTLNKENEGNISANILDLNVELDVQKTLVTCPVIKEISLNF